MNACTQVGLEPGSHAWQHTRSNHYANVTSLPPTPLGKVPFCIHSHRAHLIFLRFKIVLIEGKSTKIRTFED